MVVHKPIEVRLNVREPTLRSRVEITIVDTLTSQFIRVSGETESLHIRQYKEQLLRRVLSKSPGTLHKHLLFNSKSSL